MIISCWNIRGLNQPSKQHEVTKFIFENNIDALGLVETKVNQANESFIKSKCFKHWCFVSNSTTTSAGRIWIGWNPDRVNLTVLNSTSQLIQAHLVSDDNSVSCEVLFVYGHNKWGCKARIMV